MRRKIIRCIVALLCGICLCSGGMSVVEAKSTTKKFKVESYDLDQLIIEVEDCNVVIEETEGSKIICKIPDHRAKVSVKQSKGKLAVKITGNEESKSNLFSQITLQIPSKIETKAVEVTAKAAGVDVGLTFDADIKMVCNDGAMGYEEPEGFQHKISYELYDGSGSVTVQKEDLKEVALTEEDSAVGTPDEWEKYSMNTKEEARITIYVEGSAFALEIE